MKLKSLILTIGLSLFALSGLLAQDKYEYASVIYSIQEITFLSADKIEPIIVNKGEKAIQVLYKKLEELSAQGWELISVTEVASANYVSHTKYHLQKKKSQ
ncbi:MAG TPA: hypothetical protein VK174_18290 [Chitinophagales bacterium]|nr:hypothetical protein [Chitinophagales bacterium]